MNARKNLKPVIIRNDLETQNSTDKARCIKNNQSSKSPKKTPKKMNNSKRKKRSSHVTNIIQEGKSPLFYNVFNHSNDMQGFGYSMYDRVILNPEQINFSINSYMSNDPQYYPWYSIGSENIPSRIFNDQICIFPGSPVIHEHYSTESFPIACTFPPYFNPRAASNMPHGEKVQQWMEELPILWDNENYFKHDCYSVDLDTDWEEDEFDVPSSFVVPRNLFTTDEILQFQLKRVTTLVRKLYEFSSDLPPVESLYSGT